MPSQSNPLTADKVPSTPEQFDIANVIADDLRELGAEDVEVDEHAYVTAHWPASAGSEDKPCLGFCCHIDTAWQSVGSPVHPEVKHYEGGKLVIGRDRNGREVAVSPETNPRLAQMVGYDIVTTDGTSLLGGDDKTGDAAVVSLLARLKADPTLAHPRLAVSFVPDEEIGHGAALLDLKKFGADFGYTIDGGPLGEFCYETFNAASAKWEVNGFNIHPGSAKNMMINASLVAMEINSMLPSGDTPAHTEGYEGFFHLTDMSGTVEKAMLSYIIRDHIAASFDQRIKTMEHIEKLINEKYGEGTAKLTVRQQYRNMRELIGEHMEIVELAERALRREGIEPVTAPVRGGTDGSQLTFRGLLCPNIGTGGYSCHGPYEHITAEHLETSANIVLNIIDENLK